MRFFSERHLRRWLLGHPAGRLILQRCLGELAAEEQPQVAVVRCEDAIEIWVRGSWQRNVKEFTLVSAGSQEARRLARELLELEMGDSWRICWQGKPFRQTVSRRRDKEWEMEAILNLVGVRRHV